MSWVFIFIFSYHGSAVTIPTYGSTNQLLTNALTRKWKLTPSAWKGFLVVNKPSTHFLELCWLTAEFGVWSNNRADELWSREDEGLSSIFQNLIASVNKGPAETRRGLDLNNSFLFHAEFIFIRIILWYRLSELWSVTAPSSHHGIVTHNTLWPPPAYFIWVRDVCVEHSLLCNHSGSLCHFTQNQYSNDS